MATLTTSQEFRDRAAECEHMAEEATNAENRERMLYLANRWRSLADEGESEEESRLPQPKSKARPHAQCRETFHEGAVGECAGWRGHQNIPDANFRWRIVTPFYGSVQPRAIAPVAHLFAVQETTDPCG
jgi:hypothetical protein